MEPRTGTTVQDSEFVFGAQEGSGLRGREPAYRTTEFGPIFAYLLYILIDAGLLNPVGRYRACEYFYPRQSAVGLTPGRVELLHHSDRMGASKIEIIRPVVDDPHKIFVRPNQSVTSRHSRAYRARFVKSKVARGGTIPKVLKWVRKAALG